MFPWLGFFVILLLGSASAVAFLAAGLLDRAGWPAAAAMMSLVGMMREDQHERQLEQQRQKAARERLELLDEVENAIRKA